MIKLKSLIFESYEIVDFRDLNWKPQDEFDQKVYKSTMVNIDDKNQKIYLFRWGHTGNKIEWKDITPYSGLDNSMIVITNVKNVILPNRVGGNSKWEGSRNIFTSNTKEWVQTLLDNNLIIPNSKIYIGNWASLKGTFIGTADQVVKMDLINLPDKLIFYHGTDSNRLDDIKKDGLTPVPLEKRVWKSDNLRHHPEYREKAVYLTYDKGQANYYAKKAVNISRARGYRGTKMVILKIVIPKSHYNNLMPDDDYLARIKEKTGVSWIESLKNFSQVAYIGSIPADWIEVETIEKSKWIDMDPVDEKLYVNQI